MAVYSLPAKGIDSILCYPGCPVDATRWRLSQAGNASSPSVFSVVEMGSLLHLYTTTGLNLTDVVYLSTVAVNHSGNGSSDR